MSATQTPIFRWVVAPRPDRSAVVRLVERLHLTFERFSDDLLDGLSAAGPAEAGRSLVSHEVKVGCTLGMLQ